MPRVLPMAAVLAAACSPRAAPTPKTAMWPSIDEAFLAAYTATSRFTLGIPVPLAITRNGTVLFRRTPPRERVADLYALDPATGGERLLVSATELLAGHGEALSDAEKARRERTRTSTKGVVDVSVSDDGTLAVVPLGDRVFVVEIATGASRELDLGDGFPYDPRISPDGSHIAFVRGGELWVAALAGGAPRAVTSGAAGAIEHGVAEFAAQEELDRQRGYWWDPRGGRLLYQRTDASQVDTLYVSDPRHPENPPVPFRYPRPGRPNADVTLALATVPPMTGLAGHGGTPMTVEWDRARWPYLATVTWTGAAPPTLVVLDRDQVEVAVLAVDPSSGATRTLVVERDDAWINLAKGTPAWLDDGSGFLWMTEAPGDWVVELRDPEGAVVKQVTDPRLGARSIVGVDPARRAAWVIAGESSTVDNVVMVPLDGGAVETATTGGGIHAARHDHGVTAITSTLRDGTVAVSARRSDGGSVAIRSTAETPPYFPTTRLETVDAGDLTFHVATTRPRAFDPKRRYPVLLKVYGGPHSRTVLDTRRAYLVDQLYADAGFIVVRADNRGTPGRGRIWERAVLRDLATVPVIDQVAALRALAARHRELDLDRVGVFGWSFGGYLSALLLMKHPELFKAAVAGAPVTDWALYDTAYTERYMKLPDANRDGYARASVLTYAGDLPADRPLLVIHGITDDNVHFAHTLALIEALYLAGRRAEVVTLSSTHMVPDPKLALAQERIQLDFFRRHLAP